MPAIDDDDKPKKKIAHKIGQDLTLLSVEELAARVQLLRDEIQRIEADMKQKKARVEDALHATRAAVEEGVLPGGGVALLRCREAVEAARSSAKGDERIGVDIVLGVLAAPLKQIADNAGLSGSVVADEVSQKPTNTGYDANAGEYVDMLKSGILDPTKVVKTALANAASIAGLMLTTEALVTNYDDKDESKKAVVGSLR